MSEIARPHHSFPSFDRHGCSACRPGRRTLVVAESVLVKHQLLILNRSRIPGQLSVRIDGSGIVEGVSDATAA
jgi:hypothetical protein